MKTFPLNPAPIILVDVKLTGSRSSRFIKMIVDTGASFTMASPQILTEIGCAPILSANVKKITTASSIEHVPFVTVNSIEAFGYKVENVEIVSHMMPTSLPAEGLLGLNFLTRFNLQFLFLDSVLAVSDQRS